MTSMEYFDSLDRDFERLLRSLDPVSDLSQIQEGREFLSVGEYALALQTLVDFLGEQHLMVSAETLSMLADLADKMGIAAEIELGSWRESCG